MTKGLDVINRTGGGPLKAFCRSSTTFTSALPLIEFYPYIRVALRDKVLAPPRLKVAGLSRIDSSLPDHVKLIFYYLSLFHLSVFFVGEEGGG